MIIHSCRPCQTYVLHLPPDPRHYLSSLGLYQATFIRKFALTSSGCYGQLTFVISFENYVQCYTAIDRDDSSLLVPEDTVRRTDRSLISYSYARLLRLIEHNGASTGLKGILAKEHSRPLTNTTRTILPPRALHCHMIPVNHSFVSEPLQAQDEGTRPDTK